MEPFYVEVKRLGWGRWQWTGWDEGEIAVGRGVCLTEARADAAAHAWMRERFALRARRSSDATEPSGPSVETRGGGEPEENP